MASPQTSRTTSPRQLLGFAVAAVICALLLSSVIDLYKKHRAIRLHIAALKQDETQYRAKYDQVVSLNEQIATPEGQEYILRDKYRMVRPGEGLIVVETPDETAAPAAKDPVMSRFWQSLKRGLGISKE